MRYVLLAGMCVLGGCTTVDQTEHCVETRYGEVVTPKMDPGLNVMVFTDATCFPLTQQQFPTGKGEDGQASAEAVDFTTRDSVRVDVELAFNWKYTDANAAFVEKREHDRVLSELSNVVRSGARDGGNTMSLGDLFGPKRASLDETFRAAIQEKAPAYLVIEKVFVRSIKLPPNIVQSWQQAMEMRANQQKVRDAYLTDSLSIRGEVMKAEAQARITKLEQEAMSSSPELLKLKAVEAMAGICGKATTCILGGTVTDKFLAGIGGRQ